MTLKQLGKDGKLKKVMNAIIEEMESDHDDPDEINSDDEFWKDTTDDGKLPPYFMPYLIGKEPVNFYHAKPSFIKLLPVPKKLKKKDLKLVMDEDFDYMSAVNKTIISIQKHVFQMSDP